MGVVIQGAFELSQTKLCCWNNVPHAACAARFAQWDQSLGMTNLLLTCTVTEVLCVLLDCARQVQNRVTQAWNGGK